MDIRQLRYLAALARERHFARAAETCGVAQPTLSAAVRQLEEELGVPIVERGNRFKGLTREGERVLSWAQRILADCEALDQELSSLKSAPGGQLVLGVIPTALPMTATLTAKLHRTHPGVVLRIRSMSSIEIQRGVDAFELDGGITYLDNEPLQRVTARSLYREGLVLVAPPDSPLATRRSISWAEAAELPLGLLTTDMQNRRIIDQALKTVAREVLPQIESNSVVALLSHVRNVGCHAILPDGYCDQIGVGNVVSVPLVEPEVHHDVGLVIPNREPTPALVAALLNSLEP
ncbi:MAG: LysR family transcriptional regulator [Geminicoccaceae bacterium]